MKNKKGALGETMLMIYRIIIVSFVAVVVLGLSSLIYSPTLEVGNYEANIMAKEVVGCFDNYKWNLDDINAKYKSDILRFCGFKGDLSRFYVSVNFTDEYSNDIAFFESGDSGTRWIKDMMERYTKNLKNFKETGYSLETNDVFIVKSSIKTKAKMIVEVLVNAEK